MLLESCWWCQYRLQCLLPDQYPRLEIVDTHQDFTARKGIVPRLAIAIERAVAEDLNVLTSPDPESDGLLKIIVEVVGLPVIDVIGKLVRLET